MYKKYLFISKTSKWKNVDSKPSSKEKGNKKLKPLSFRKKSVSFTYVKDTKE